MRTLCILFVVMIIYSGCKPSQQIINKGIVYNPNNQTIGPLKEKEISLKRKEIYKFCIVGVNDGYHDVVYDIRRTKKDITIPDILKPYVPQELTPVKTAELKLNRYEEFANASFISKLESAFNKLNSYYLHADTEIANLEKNIYPPDTCKNRALAFIKASSQKVGLADTNTNCALLFKQVDSLITDVENRIALMKANNHIKDDEGGLQIYNADTFIWDNKAGMKKFPYILDGYKKCKDTIFSKPYMADKTDYIDISFTLFGHKYSDQKDSILSSKIRFYRIHYLTFDVTTGFFGTDLFSQSYHFTDSFGHTNVESKSKIDISVGALAHLNFVITSAIKVGICGGAGISILDGKPKVLFGASIILGRSAEFAISGGLAYASVPVPSNALTLAYQSSVETPVPTYNKFKQGCFIGISYNIIQK